MQTVRVNARTRLAARVVTGAGCLMAALLVTAAPALAGRMSYAVSPGANYTVTAEGHGHGIVKVDFNTCVTPGQAVTLPMTVTPSGNGAATLKVIKEQGPGSISLSPSTTTFTAGQPQSFTVTLTPDSTAMGHGPAYRFKLAATPGSGLGEGPGVMVRFPCVLAPGTPCSSAQSTDKSHGDGSPADSEEQNGNDEAPICVPAPGQPAVCPASSTASPQGDGLPPGQVRKQSKPAHGRSAHASQAGGNGKGKGHSQLSAGSGNNGNGNGNGQGNANATPTTSPADDPANCAPLSGTAGFTTSGASTPTPLAAPTAGRFGVLGTRETAGTAACLAAPRHLRVHAGETTLVTVAVRTSGQRIQGALVRVLAPGVRIVKRTGRSGSLTFRVTPTRTGSLIIQSDVCFGAARSRVLAARTSTRMAPPAFTG